MAMRTPVTVGSAVREPGWALARFRRAEGGATAVEFGLLAMPFFALMFAILEVAMVFWTSQVVETATQAAARQIYTGQFQADPNNNQSGQTATQLAQNFKTALCQNLIALVDCSANVYVDIRNITTFSTASVPPMIVNGAFNTGAFAYQQVPPDSLALVTVATEYQTITKMFLGTPGLSNGNRVIVSTAIFKTEPYQPYSP